MHKLYDVIVVGAGPVGSYTARRLAASGHSVVVLEKHTKPRETICCTGIVGKQCLDRFPIDEKVILRGSSSAKFFSPSGEYLRMEKETTQAYILDRPAFDATLAKDAQDGGADYLYNIVVNSIMLREDRVSVGIENSRTNIDGKIIVIASGFHSHLPQRLGLGRINSFVAGAQAEVTTDVDEVEVYFSRKLAPTSFAWLVPTAQGKALAGLHCRHRPGTHLRQFLIHLFDQGKITSPEVSITYKGIPLKPLARTYGERVIAVGDAAGQVKPTTGGGIYYGLLCAEKAVDTIVQAIQEDNYSANRLRNYEKEWKRKLSSEISWDRRARWLFERLSDDRMERIFRLIVSRGIHESILQHPEFSFDWHKGMIRSGLRQMGLRGVFELLNPI